MIIIEFPIGEESSQQAVSAVLGSCRVRNPLTLDGVGDGAHWKLALPGASHTLKEAHQIREFYLNNQAIAQEFLGFIFDHDTLPTPTKQQRHLATNLDLGIVEICDSIQVKCKSLVFQVNYFVRNFVQKLPKKEGLNWWRTLSLTGFAGSAENKALLDALHASGAPVTDATRNIIAHTTLEKADPGIILNDLCKLVEGHNHKWLVIGPLIVPGLEGAIMADRHSLAEGLKSACTKLGIAYRDYCALIEHHGRQKILDGNGADVNHFAESALPLIRQTLLLWAREAVGSDVRPKSEIPIVQCSRRVNASLEKLHEERLNELGESESGLEAHYVHLLKHGRIVGLREEVVLDYLNEHDFIPDSDFLIAQAGLGQLAFVLAALGRKVIAHDVTLKRREAIFAGRERLASEGLIDPNLVKVAEILEAKKRGKNRSVAIGLSMVLGVAEEDQTTILQLLSSHDALIIEPRTFLRMRDSEEEKAEVIRLLADYGMEFAEDIPGASAIVFRKVS